MESRDNDVGRGDETQSDGVRWREGEKATWGGYKTARRRYADDDSTTRG